MPEMPFSHIFHAPLVVLQLGPDGRVLVLEQFLLEAVGSVCPVSQELRSRRNDSPTPSHLNPGGILNRFVGYPP